MHKTSTDCATLPQLYTAVKFSQIQDLRFEICHLKLDEKRFELFNDTHNAYSTNYFKIYLHHSWQQYENVQQNEAPQNIGLDN